MTSPSSRVWNPFEDRKRSTLFNKMTQNSSIDYLNSATSSDGDMRNFLNIAFTLKTSQLLQSNV